MTPSVAPPPPSLPRVPGPVRVLVVEDHQDSRELLEEFLLARGYAVDTAGNGLEALARLERAPAPDVVLLDLMMPVMSGWELMQWVRGRPELTALPVVVVSGAGSASRLPEGVRAAVPKPVDFDTLTRALQRVCAAPPGPEALAAPPRP